jgi:multidrug efflux pump subunit AcrA (membrane-fusion protein)
MRTSQALSLGTMIVLLALATAGCDQPADSGASDMDNLANQLQQSKEARAAADAATAAAQAKAAEEAAQAQEEARKAAAEAAAKAQPAAEENETSITITVKNPQGLFNSPEAKEAMAGIVGKKQRKNRVDGPLRYYGALANARIIAMDRALGWQIKSALDVYVNGENDGKYPQTTEEFMKKVVEPNMIELPELQPNQEYYFDPKQHELVILERIEEPADAEPAASEPATESTPPIQN